MLSAISKAESIDTIPQTLEESTVGDLALYRVSSKNLLLQLLTHSRSRTYEDLETSN